MAVQVCFFGGSHVYGFPSSSPWLPLRFPLLSAWSQKVITESQSKKVRVGLFVGAPASFAGFCRGSQQETFPHFGGLRIDTARGLCKWSVEESDVGNGKSVPTSPSCTLRSRLFGLLEAQRPLGLISPVHEEAPREGALHIETKALLRAQAQSPKRGETPRAFERATFSGQAPSQAKK